ncbi:hypothetical protein AOT83_20920 [Mycobacteroides sp. H001]|uniref:hypothetical protein n=1 Tax=Mycobacteroides TaxID=670516 RepID=UPI00071271FB|nr:MULTISPECIES: hypothetical protein [Mycobacteroides]KRQ20788.1 hypothetical protein AOT86_21885 [Mycobacteroides sp. H072]KRQ38144.1 hypothetical protein AOT84_10755 [Mycobacteroides sp. H002]KRQ52944.1 hypothetical protein AOT85_07940 [Mycobacteroides sp. H054]KRQ66970.1 hypothetical protein AOT83_20920 [Mycobacteroides sp. H001]OHU36416.1 hypothetical protein BKG79_19505 [Mycobacteroides chelonae]
MTTRTPGLDYFKLKGFMDAVVTDEVDENLVPDRKGINARVTVTPLVNDKDYPEVVATIEGAPRIEVLCPVVGRLDDGVLKTTATQADIWLVANTAIIGLPDDALVYRVEFSESCVQQGPRPTPDAAQVRGPNIADAVVDLSSIAV